MKINDIIQETTSAGGIATVAAPLGAMQKRPNASVFANTTPKKKKKKKTSEAEERYPEITQSKAEEIISAWEYQEDLIDIGNGYQILSGENQEGYQDNDALLVDKDFKVVDSDNDIEDLLNNHFAIIQGEGKSPHKKGTKKYKKHMAAMHAEATLQTGGYGKPKKSRHQQKI